MRTVAVAVLLGLLVGIVAALVRESLDDAVTSSRQLLDDDALSTLASIPMDGSSATIGALMHDQRGPWAEAFRRLRARLFPAGRLGPRTVMVTGCGPRSGTTTVTCGLGITLARAGVRVLIVGADLRHPALAGQLWIRDGSGLAEVLDGQIPLEQALQPRGDGMLTVLPAGGARTNAGELLGGDRMITLMADLEDRFDVVLIEAPPVLPFADAVIIAGVAGCGALLVVAHGRTTRDQVQAAVRLLQDGAVPVLGAVLTMVPDRDGDTGVPRAAAHRARHPDPQIDPVDDPAVAAPSAVDVG